MKPHTTIFFAAVLAAACSDAPAPQPQATPETTANTEAAEIPAPEAAQAGFAVAAAAPAFELPDLDGKAHNLADYKGKTVVLEWFNPGCPFVVAAHDGGPLGDMAKKVTGEDVVWLAVNSGAPGKQGHGIDTNKEAAQSWGMEHPILVDESGSVGKAYQAKTTPYMVVIGPDQTVQYAGALDNAPRNEKPETGYSAFTAQAIDAVKAGQVPTPAQTTSWGCSVKYGS